MMNWSLFAHFACLALSLGSWYIFSWSRKNIPQAWYDLHLNKFMISFQGVLLFLTGCCLLKEYTSGNLVFALYDFILMVVLVIYIVEITKANREENK